MNPDQNPLLDQLRDIHVVSEPSWWPPGPAWWVLAFLAFLLLAWLAQELMRRWSLARRKRAWLDVLEDIGGEEMAAAAPREWLDRISRLFRAVALQAFPGTRCARLEGDEWVRFIQARLPAEAPLDAVSALAAGPWQRMPEFDSHALHEVARLWVKRHG